MKSLTLILMCILLFSCASSPKKLEPQKAPPNLSKEFRAAQVYAGKSEYRKALARLDKITTGFPDSDLADDANFLAGRIHMAEQDYSAAYVSYMNIVNSKVISPLETDAMIRAATALERLNRADEALDLLDRAADSQDIAAEMFGAIHEARFNLLAASQRNMEALETLVLLGEKHPNTEERERYKALGREFLESRLTDEQLVKVAGSNRFAFLQAQARFRYGLLMVERRDFARARRYFELAIEAAPGSELAERSAQWIRQIDARQKVDPRTIGVVLPLSGRHKAIGYRTLQGIQLGLGIYGKNPSNFRLAVIDSEGNPDIARRAVERLVTEDNVIAIIGSLLSRTAVAVASKANEFGVPSIALSQKAGVTQVGDTVFRNAMTSQAQVHHLVDVAMNQLGMKRFAIMFPNDPYGTEYANLFWDEVNARGGSIRAAQPYDPKETDFRAPVQRLVGTFYQDDRSEEYRARLKVWQEKNPKKSARQSLPDDLLPPVVDFDAIFLPDNVRAVGQIAPMLAYADVKNVRLLGTNLWNTGAFVQRGQKAVEDAVFVDSFLASDRQFRNSEFFTNYKDTFGEEPGVFEVQGYDSALVLRQLIASGEATRPGLTQRLSSLKSLPGALGALAVSPEREIKRPLVSLTVDEGKITSLDTTKQ